MTQVNIDQHEQQKFSNLANDWWDLSGPLKTLHDINPARLAIEEAQRQYAERYGDINP